MPELKAKLTSVQTEPQNEFRVTYLDVPKYGNGLLLLMEALNHRVLGMTRPLMVEDDYFRIHLNASLQTINDIKNYINANI